MKNLFKKIKKDLFEVSNGYVTMKINADEYNIGMLKNDLEDDGR